jgi:predicted Zn-dependent protease
MAYVSGTVFLDPRKFARAYATEEPGVAEALILHELGHLVGLAHVSDPRSIMYPELTGRVTRYSAGDRVGLAMLGRGSCQPRL